MVYNNVENALNGEKDERRCPVDPFKIGLRNLIGIMAPGAIVLLALAYGLTGVVLVLDNSASSYLSLLKDMQWFVIISALLLSYLLGNIFRLYSADDLDALSSRRLERECLECLDEKHTIAFINKRHEIMKDPDPAKLLLPLFAVEPLATVPDDDEGFERWLWSTELFPYPTMALLKLSRYRPLDMAKYFETCHEVLKRIFDLVSPVRKELFDYCKMVVAAQSTKQEGPLVQEVQAAEANVRFLAGTYFALEFSSMLIVVLQLWMMALMGARSKHPATGVGVCLTSVAVYGAYKLWKRKLQGGAVYPDQYKKLKELPTTDNNKTTILTFLHNFEYREKMYSKHRILWALNYSLYAVAAMALIVSWIGSIRLIMHDYVLGQLHTNAELGLLIRATSILLASFALIRLMGLGCGLIVGRFRHRRIMEVDTVFEAFYLVQQKMPPGRKPGAGSGSAVRQSGQSGAS